MHADAPAPTGAQPQQAGLFARQAAIWVFAAIYFACYVPYTALTKAISSGSYSSGHAKVAGATLLPVANLSALAVLIAFLLVTGLWRSATRVRVAGLSLPWAGGWTALSGVCMATILVTTTLAYTFEGVSIVFVMLLLRGGVLMIAPLVDVIAARQIRWYSWLGLLLALAALIVAFADRGGYSITLACAVNVGVYLLAYLVRLRVMTRVAKSRDVELTKRYFVEEQLVSTPLSVVVLALLAALGPGTLAHEVRAGFTSFLHAGLIGETMLIGALSQGVMLFGSLVFLDHRENSYSVPVNRSASILAGVVGALSLTVVLGAAPPSASELGGAGLVLLAIMALALGPAYAARRSA